MNKNNPWIKKFIFSIKLLRHGSGDLFFRSLLFGRGRRKRFGVAPAVRTIKKSLQAHPLISNCVFYGSLYAGAEFSQQTIRNYMHGNTTLNNNNNKTSKSYYDYSALKRYAFMGTVIFPPILHKWYLWLDKKFPTGNLAKKLILDQFLLTPVLVAMFFVGMSMMEGKDDVTLECKQKFANTFFYDCLFWLPMQAINFVYIPTSFRVVFIAMCSFIWLNFLCTIKNMPINVDNNMDTSLQP